MAAKQASSILMPCKIDPSLAFSTKLAEAAVTNIIILLSFWIDTATINQRDYVCKPASQPIQAHTKSERTNKATPFFAHYEKAARARLERQNRLAYVVN